MNMQVLRKSRGRLWPGDIFVYRLTGLYYGFGRVIRTRTKVCLGQMPACLVYFYRARSTSKNNIPALTRNELLLPPDIVGPELWSLGYFENVARRRLRKDDVLPAHCFFDNLIDGYVDELGRRLPKLIEPCGIWGITGYAAVDRLLSEAHGIAPRSDTVPDRERLFGSTIVPSTASVAAGQKPRRQCGMDHAVIVSINGPNRRSHSKAFTDRLFALEKRLEELVTVAKVGCLDGDQIAMDSSVAEIHLFGKSADQLAAIVLPHLRTAGLPRGSYLLKRYGKPGAPEERIEL